MTTAYKSFGRDFIVDQLVQIPSAAAQWIGLPAPKDGTRRRARKETIEAAEQLANEGLLVIHPNQNGRDSSTLLVRATARLTNAAEPSKAKAAEPSKAKA